MTYASLHQLLLEGGNRLANEVYEHLCPADAKIAPDADRFVRAACVVSGLRCNRDGVSFQCGCPDNISRNCCEL